MDPKLSLRNFLTDPVETPAGLIVPAKDIGPLVKAEARRQKQEENKAAFFSRFALAQNMVAYGAREKPLGTPQFPILYEAAEKSFVDAILIRARVDQMKRIWQKAIEGKSKEIGFKVVHERDDDKDFKGSKEIDERCREMERLLIDPTPVAYTYLYPHNVRPHTRMKDLAAVLTKAELIIDRKVLLRYKRKDGQGYAAFHWLPGETVKPVDESIREWARKNEPSGKVGRDTIERMSYATGFDLANSSYVQMLDGMITAAFTDDEVSVHISNPSDRLNRFGYGTSRLELSLDVTSTLLMAWNYNKELFKTNYPEAILTVAGDFDKDGLQAFKQQILSESGGVGNNWRLPIIPAGDVENFKVESHKLRDTPKDMMFDHLLRMILMFKCFKYDTVVETMEHGPMMIGKIAVNKIPVHLKSFNKSTGEVCWAKVTDWQVMKESKWVNITYPGGNGKHSIDVTHEHDLWNGTEMVPAGTLQKGDTLYVKSPTLTYEQEQVVLGSLLGDGTIRKATREQSYGCPCLTESHSESQQDYFMWKISAYENLAPKWRKGYTTAVKNGTQKYSMLSFNTMSAPVLWKYREMCLDAHNGKKRVTWEWLSKIDILGLAVWFMDDGAFHKQKQQTRYSSSITLMPGTHEEISFYWRYFAEKWGLHPRISKPKGKKCWTIRFSVDETDRLRDLLAPYLTIAPPISMFSPTRKQWHAPTVPVGKTEGLAPIKILDIKHYTVEKGNGRPCYDVTVEGTHTLFANNLASSNCSSYGAHPSTLNLEMDSGTGGNALSSHDPASEIEFSKEQGLIPAIADLCDWLTDAIIKPRYDDLKLIVVGMNPEDEQQAVNMRTSRVSKWVTRNEARQEEGKEPIGDEKDPVNPWNYPADVPIPNYINTFNMIQQQQQEDDQGDDQEQVQKAIPGRPLVAPMKFLHISLDDQL